MSCITVFRMFGDRAGNPVFVESPLLERPAIAEWANREVGGWWTLRKLGQSFAGHQLWEMTRPTTKFEGRVRGNRQELLTRWRIVSTLRRAKPPVT